MTEYSAVANYDYYMQLGGTTMTIMRKIVVPRIRFDGLYTNQRILEIKSI
ncbi:hypothetical protein NTE_03477 [Candidatus Nitrososphaera evergladensis SR1]|uniref:Uncharacterized protein n=1 Tax=Candidatus Nitrososphaera evergladensis SR1 TaxID=1459636 RepID=A0A075MW77_9ARCH|nr:hypothetical protein NTE_03477 [Candidatus Nitrososphaera evergladensis SR1]